MFGGVRSVVGGGAVRQVSVLDQVQLFKQLESPVDRGDVDAGRALSYPGEDVFGSRVSELSHRIENELPLWRKPVATRAEFVLESHNSQSTVAGRQLRRA